jgi:hypothetical protein
VNEGSVQYLWNYTEGEHKSTCRKNQATDTLTTTSATLTGLGSNPGHCFERSVTNRLSHVVRFPVEVRHFSCLQVVQIGPGGLPRFAFKRCSTRGCFPANQAVGDNSLPFSAQVRNEWSCISTLLMLSCEIA